MSWEEDFHTFLILTISIILLFPNATFTPWKFVSERKFSLFLIICLEYTLLRYHGEFLPPSFSCKNVLDLVDQKNLGPFVSERMDYISLRQVRNIFFCMSFLHLLMPVFIDKIKAFLISSNLRMTLFFEMSFLPTSRA